jgi:hypothetical protein
VGRATRAAWNSLPATPVVGVRRIRRLPLKRDMPEGDYAQEYENDFDVAGRGNP